MSTKAKSLERGAVIDALPAPASQPRLAPAGVGQAAARGQPARRLFERSIVRRAISDSFSKLDPRHQVRNPVMFVVEVGASSRPCSSSRRSQGEARHRRASSSPCRSALWFTVLFANFAEAMAEGRGKAQADSLRQARRETPAKRLSESTRDAPVETISSSLLRKGDVVLIEAGDDVPCDGDVIEGVASVNEAAITGESAPVIREAGGDRSAVVARDARALGLARREGRRRSGPHVPRPDDRHGRRGPAPEDAERDRARRSCSRPSRSSSSSRPRRSSPSRSSA